MPIDLSILENKYVLGIASAIGGAVLMLLAQQFTNRRALFTYFVHHSRVGVSADDAVFGSVRVMWNNNLVANLYSSTVELINHSLKDFENVVVKIYTSDTILLTERTEIVGTSHIVRWTDEYVNSVRVPAGQQPTDLQREIHGSSRDFLVPTMNRGQVVRFHFLNAAKSQNQPTLWLDVLHKGVRHKFRVPQNQFLGVPQPRAAMVGVLVGILLLVLLVTTTESVLVAAGTALLYGFVAQLPGALAIRAWRAARDWFSG
jgi:hypothetical protein